MPDAIALVKRRARSAKLLRRQQREDSAAAVRARGGEAPGAVVKARPPKLPSRGPRPAGRPPHPEAGAVAAAAAAAVAAAATATATATAAATAPTTAQPPMQGSLWGFPAVPPLAMALNFGLPLHLADAVARRGETLPARPVACRAQLPEAVLAHLGLEHREALRLQGEDPPAAAEPTLARPVACPGWPSPRRGKGPRPGLSSRTGSGSAETLVDATTGAPLPPPQPPGGAASPGGAGSEDAAATTAGAPDSPAPARGPPRALPL